MVASTELRVPKAFRSRAVTGAVSGKYVKTCTITNNDQAVDLALTKSDGNVSRASGDQTPFPYTITVQNVGPREVDDETVTVVDDLPAAFEWVSPAPAGCTIDGQKLTCDVAPAGLRPEPNSVRTAPQPIPPVADARGRRSA